MTRLNHEIDGLALDLAWSLWAELGVEGIRRRHDWQAIDLEPLIIFTAYVGNTDSRLRANSIDWCIANSRFASAFRLRNLALAASPVTREAFGRYAATVKAHAKVPWPSHGDPLALWTSEHIGPPDLRRPIWKVLHGPDDVRGRDNEDHCEAGGKPDPLRPQPSEEAAKPTRWLATASGRIQTHPSRSSSERTCEPS